MDNGKDILESGAEKGKTISVTPAGKQKLLDELENLKTVERPRIIEKIGTARGYGDLSENSEYDEAKNRQGIIEGRIEELEEMLKHIVVVEEVSTKHVGVGTRVKLRRVESGREQVYDIVGSTEADPNASPKRISDRSPIGSALIGHGKGEEVKIATPSGETRMKILGIETTPAKE